MPETASPALISHTVEWRRKRADALSESQRKRPETREVCEPLELRDASQDGTRTLRSYASLFNAPYTVSSSGYRFEEVVRPGAFKRTLGTRPDVVFRYDHTGPPLARTSSGTLRLGEDERGLWYEADLNPNDPDVKALIPKIERGDLSESSFAFRIGHNGDKWNDERSSREVLACELDRGDVSVVTFGASRATGKHLLLRSEALEALQDIGFENLLAALVEWRDFTLLSTEERAGKVLSSTSLEALKQVLGLISNADDAVDEAQAQLADLMGVPNPDSDLRRSAMALGEEQAHEEDYWTAIKRLAEEVGWRYIVRDGQIYVEMHDLSAEEEKPAEAEEHGEMNDAEIRAYCDEYWEGRRDFSAKQRQGAAKSGAAMPDGSFPIQNAQDLKNAIQAVGRAKNPSAAKAHIKKRAAALGLTKLIPDSWRSAEPPTLIDNDSEEIFLTLAVQNARARA